MLARFQTAVSLLYPPRCLGCGSIVDSDFGLCGRCWRETPFIGGPVCDACGAPIQGRTDGHRAECDYCMKTPRPWSRGRAALLYKDRARQMVLALKHGDQPEIAKPAALWMLSAGQPLLCDDLLIAPVPLHWTRFVKRRYNQSSLLARALARETGLPCCPDLLTRPKRTRMLDGKSAAERFDDLRDAISVPPKRRHQMVARRVLLIDDVMTTGATLTACSVACLNAGAKDVLVLTLARVAKDD